MMDCPRCGCNDSQELERRPYRRGDDEGEQSKRICQFCGKVFWVKIPAKAPAKAPGEGVDTDAVDFRPTVQGGAKCPRCGKFPVRVVSAPKQTSPRVRYHKCEQCGWNGKSIEDKHDEERTRV